MTPEEAKEFVKVIKEIANEQRDKIKDLISGTPSDPGQTGQDNRGFINAVSWITWTGAGGCDRPSRDRLRYPT